MTNQVKDSRQTDSQDTVEISQAAAEAQAHDMPGADQAAPPVEAAEHDELAAEQETTAVQDPAELAAALEAAKAEAQANWDRLLRVQADAENERRRMEKDLDKARKFALQDFAMELLGVRDSLELGVAAAQDTDDTAKIREGTELTLNMLVQAMEKHGIEEIDPVGERFNPDLHQAMGMQESETAAPNTVLHVVQKGYRLNERLLRPAMVMVAKAPTDNSASA